MNSVKTKELYKTIAKDLSIWRFVNETDREYNNRLVYSAIGRWVLTMFLDRDYEGEELEQVSKAHVTISAQRILRSFLKNDNDLNDYFYNVQKCVETIENTYEKLGYIESNPYYYFEPTKNAMVRINNESLIINARTNKKRMIGLGIWSKKTDTSIGITEFLPIHINASEYFEKMISISRFSEFINQDGKVDIFNIKYKRWEPFSTTLANKYEYSILKIDNGLEYKIIKNIGGLLFSSKVPDIYTKSSNDKYFEREIWRLIFGLCSICGYPATCEIRKNSADSVLFRCGGYVFPSFEDALWKCICWPINTFDNINEYVTYSENKESVFEILNNLSIEIVEVD